MKKSLSIVFIVIVSSIFLYGRNTSTFIYSLHKAPGDTIVYKASMFVIQPDDKLENLLIKLPGIKIDKAGKIYAQGDIVKQIFLDGEEFFSDSPDVAAHTIRADEVDKILSYYRVSDQAAFTGVEDKVRIRVLDVRLKKGK